MKYHISIITVFVLIVNFSSSQNSLKTDIDLRPEIHSINLEQSEIVIKGTSTLHDWESRAGKSEARLVFKNYTGGEIEQLNLNVDVASIKNTKGHNIMDKLTRKALKNEDFPEITYVFIKGDLISDTTKELKVKLIGDLTIAGKTNQISVLTTIDKSATNVTLNGQHKLKMTDYGVEPPKALFGTVKTGNEITIDFSIKF